ncbi:MAG: thiamine pyrophosphate-binding protein [Betaproteobacteria bacterium]|nr:thiamine pyrophosphate-binding protein [Betaproteobacteria bacterium]
MGQITVALALARLLERMGTEILFGVNGHGNWALLDALVHETKIRGVPARSEDHAVEMADGYWRMRRCAPLPIVTTSVGPGNMNIVPAIATAFYESIGLLVLAGAGATHWFDRGGLEESYRNGPEDWVAVLKPITKKSFLVTRPDTAIDMFLRAYQTALSGRPGPVVMQGPFDIQHTLISDTLPDPAPWMQWRPPAPEPAGVQEAVALLKAAQRPLVVVGSGIHNARAWDELLAFAEATGIPVATTSTGKGAFPEENALSVGCVGRAGTGHGNAAARRCDVVVGIGTHFTDMDTGGWTLFDIPDRTRLIHLDIDSTELGRAYPAAVGLTCDARLGLDALTQAARVAGVSKRADWLKEIARERQAWEQSVSELRSSNIAPLHYARICHDTGEVVAEKNPQMPVFFDTGHLLSFAPPFLKASSRHVVHSGFMHRMGWSAAAAIGASIAKGNCPAMALLGDGAFMMRGTAVATAVEQNLPIIWVVFNNGSLQIERELMFRLYGRESFCDYRKVGHKELWNPDFCKWAEAMGAQGIHVGRAEDYAPALRRALDARTPTVIDVEVSLDIKGYRSVWYPYPSNFHESWAPGPLPADAQAPAKP